MDNAEYQKKLKEVDPHIAIELFNRGAEYMKRTAPKHEVASQETKDLVDKLESKMVTREVFELMFKDLKGLIELKFSNNEKGHKAIEEQTTKTNGRVTKLEKWQVKMITVGSTLSILFTAAIAIIGLFN